jgi:hypothetical protein
VALRLRPMADFGPEQYEVVFEADMSGASILPTDTIGIRGLSPAPPRGWSANKARGSDTSRPPRRPARSCYFVTRHAVFVASTASPSIDRSRCRGAREHTNN